MSAPDSTPPTRPPPTLFLSYASQDRPAAQTLRDALPSFGIEVWYDASELVGGDAWDQKIRRQIRECDYFMPLISSNTEARAEGYFRREWRLAVERSLDMADDHIFLLPVVIDDTVDSRARVPDKFFAVQWLRLPGGQPNAALEALCRRLVAGTPVESPAVMAPALAPATAPATAPAQTPAQAQSAPSQRSKERVQPIPREFPPFPTEQPGQSLRFWFMIAGWLFMTAWVAFNRLPRWVRICAYVWLSVFMLSRMGSDKQSSDISPADAKKLQTIAQNYQGSGNKADIAKLAAQIGQAFSDDDDQKATDQSAVLAVPFDASAGDPAGQTLANTTFAQTYGRIAISSHGHVALADQPLSSADPVAAATLGRAHHASYVLYGAIDRPGGSDSRSAAGAVPAAPILTVTLLNVATSAVLWSKSYPLAGAVPATIAAEIDGHVPPISTSKGNEDKD